MSLRLVFSVKGPLGHSDRRAVAVTRPSDYSGATARVASKLERLAVWPTHLRAVEGFVDELLQSARKLEREKRARQRDDAGA
jgi:hypothetical protein